MVSVLQKKCYLGYACINTKLREQDIFMSRTCRLATLRQRGIQYVYELALQNLQDLEVILKWNFDNGIFLFRLSSEIFPFATHADYFEEYSKDFDQIFGAQLKRLGELVTKYQQRVTFHPGQFTQLSSERDSVVINSIREIDFHARILDSMNCNKDSVIVIHGGSKAGGKDAALGRLKTSFYKLSESSQRRLVLENCEMCYSVEDLLPVCQELGVPLVLDFHHHNINPGTKSLENYIKAVLDTWNSRQIKPKFHLSESRDGITVDDSITKRRAHSDYIKEIPMIFYKFAQQSLDGIDLMFEAKMKEDSVLQWRKLN
jgi:UV DNA damage endonuclease